MDHEMLMFGFVVFVMLGMLIWFIPALHSAVQRLDELQNKLERLEEITKSIIYGGHPQYVPEEHVDNKPPVVHDYNGLYIPASSSLMDSRKPYSNEVSPEAWRSEHQQE